MTKEYGRMAIFKVDNKKSDNHPDYNGKITITQTMAPGTYDVGLYIKQKDDGKRYQAGKIKDAWKKPESGISKPKPINAYVKTEDSDDDFAGF